MKTTRFATLALASALALGTGAASAATPAAPAATELPPVTAQAQPQRPGPDGAGPREHGPRGHGPRGGEAREHERGPRGGPAAEHQRGPRHAMRALDLTDAQKDQIFALRHAAAPELRKLMKAGFDSRKALQEMARSGQFDEARAQALAKTGAEAQAQAAVLRTRLQADTVALLTPEQREKAGRWLAEGPGHGERHPGGMMRPMR